MVVVTRKAGGRATARCRLAAARNTSLENSYSTPAPTSLNNIGSPLGLDISKQSRERYYSDRFFILSINFAIQQEIS